MWIFESKKRNSFLAANPKVLTQTLRYQKNLSRLTGKRQYLHFLLKSMGKQFGPEYVMLVRNPYNRVESFFKEKLRQKVRKALDAKQPYILKRHQMIFYDFLGINKSASVQHQVDSLLGLDFKSFVKLIPRVYHLEDHIAPQTYNFSLTRFGMSLTMHMNRYVKLESAEDMVWMAKYFDLDLSERRNSTIEEQELLEWDDECISIVQRIYKRDFEIFGYDANRQLM